MVKISNLFIKLIVFFAVIGIIFLLTMYNAKLLYVLNWFKTSNQFYDKLIIFTAAVAYSLGSISVVIWYNPKRDDNPKFFLSKYLGATFLKVLFVLIDGFHVYIYNNTHIDDLATWLSPVYAVQTALILFFIGAIVNDFIKAGKNRDVQKMVFNAELEIKQDEINEHQSKIENLETNINDLETDIEDKKTVIKDQKSKIDNLESNIIQFESKVKELQTYYKSYIKYEASHIRKKKPENRTEQDILILEEAESI